MKELALILCCICLSSFGQGPGVYEGYSDGNSDNTLVVYVTSYGKAIGVFHDFTWGEIDLFHTDIREDGSFFIWSLGRFYWSGDRWCGDKGRYTSATDFKIDIRNVGFAVSTVLSAKSLSGYIDGDFSGYIDVLVLSDDRVFVGLEYWLPGISYYRTFQTTESEMIAGVKVPGALTLTGDLISGTYGSKFESSSFYLFGEPISPLVETDSGPVFRSHFLGWINLEHYPWLWIYSSSSWAYIHPGQEPSGWAWMWSLDNGWVCVYYPWFPWGMNTSGTWVQL